MIFSGLSGIDIPDHSQRKEVSLKLSHKRCAQDEKIKDEEKAKILRERAGEFGTVTGRPRDVGHLDLLSLAYAIGVNGGNDNVIALTKTDVFDGVDIEVAGTYLKGDEVLHRFPRDNTILSECVGYDY